MPATPWIISIEKFQVLLQEEHTKLLDYTKSLELKFRDNDLFLETLADEELQNKYLFSFKSQFRENSTWKSFSIIGAKFSTNLLIVL